MANEYKKFLFNAHNFDEPDEDEVQEEVYVPPTFSEDELELAKQKAFKEGKQAGLEESAASREQQITNILSQIASSFPDLLLQEDDRAKLYEVEAVRLAATMFDALYPLLKERLGEEELKRQILDIMQAQDIKSAIIIQVHPDLADSVDEMLQKSLETAPGEVTSQSGFTVKGDDSLDIQSFKIAWKDGGALHNGTELARMVKQEIKAHLDTALAPLPGARHDNETNSADEAPDAPAPDQTKTEPAAAVETNGADDDE